MRKKCAKALIEASGVIGMSAHQKTRRGTLVYPLDSVGGGTSSIKSLRKSIIVLMSQWESAQLIIAMKWM